ncbi:MAG: putative secreted protein [Chlamydiia bacterium]|nr:putative secreted protein [Chlamydiia bacterium]
MKLYYLFMVTLCASSYLLGDIDPRTILKQQQLEQFFEENISIPLASDESKEWDLGFMQVQSTRQAMFHWISPEENINQWSALVQIEYFPYQPQEKKHLSAASFTTTFLHSIKKQFPTVRSNFISKKNGDILFEWTLPQAVGKQLAQQEIVRVLTTEEGLYRLAYTKKGAAMSPELRAHWKELLSTAKVEMAN